MTFNFTHQQAKRSVGCHQIDLRHRRHRNLFFLLLFLSLIISGIWSIKLSNPFKTNELARPLGALYFLGQDLVSPPGPPNQISVHLWHPTRVEHTWQPTRGVLGGTHLYIQHENVSSIDCNNERLNLWRKASFLYRSSNDI